MSIAGDREQKKIKQANWVLSMARPDCPRLGCTPLGSLVTNTRISSPALRQLSAILYNSYNIIYIVLFFSAFLV